MSKSYPENQFLPLTENDLKQVLCWRNSPRIRANMHNSQEIHWDEHKAWFAGLQADESREFWLLYQNEKPIGILNFSGIGTPRIEWGCYLGELSVWPGSGLLFEVAALDHAAAMPLADYLVAEVLSFNQSAVNMHKFFKYPLVKTQKNLNRADIKYDLYYYEYALSSWLENRDRILSRLPKAIRIQVDNMSFR